jgi:hypothetical protein
MKHIFCFLLLLCALPARAQTNPLSYTAALPGGTTCGAGNNTTTANCSGYNAPPTLGAAGTSTTDPDFGNKSLRITSRTSYCGEVANRSYSSAQDGSARVFNDASPPTAVLVYDAEGGAWFVQPVNLTAMTSNPASCVPIVGFGGPCGGVQPIFAATNPNLVYCTDVDGVHFDSYNWVTLTKTQLLNISTGIPGCSITSAYLNYGDANDAWFLFSNNSQDLGTEVCAWNQSNSNTSVLNVPAATSKLNSAAPVALDNLTAGNLTGCVIHSIQPPAAGGTYFQVSFDSCSSPPSPPTSDFAYIYWQVATNHVIYTKDSSVIGGHKFLGLNALGTGSGSCSPYVDNAMEYWLFSNFGGDPGNWAGITPCTPQALYNFSDNHMSNLNDANDAFVDTYPYLSFQLTSTAPLAGTAYEFELDMITPSPALTNLNGSSFRTFPASVTAWRGGHSYNSAVNVQCGWMAYTGAQISGDGKFIAYTSNYMGGTGTGSGACSGTPTQSTDLFILALPVAASSSTPIVPPGRLPLFTYHVENILRNLLDSARLR